MKIEVTNIPKGKFQKIQSEILKVLIKNGFKDIDTIVIEDGVSCEFEGFEFEIQIEKSNRPSITSSSASG